MARTDTLEWCDGNMHCNYPLADSASGRSVAGHYLPTSFLVDFQMVIPENPDTDTAERFFISAVTRIGSGIYIELSYKAPESTFVCARSATIDSDLGCSADIKERTIAITPEPSSIPDAYSTLRNLSGRFIIGTCADMRDTDSYTFLYGDSNLSSLRVYVYSPVLQQVAFTDSGNATHTFTNSFILKAGDGIDFSVRTVFDSERQQNVDEVSVIRTQTEEESRREYSSVTEIVNAVRQLLGNPVLRINGIAPDSSGNFSLLTGDCVTADATSSGVVISNPCSKPCCDSTSYSDLEASLLRLEEAHQLLTEHYRTLSTNINIIQGRLSSLIASR